MLAEYVVPRVVNVEHVEVPFLPKRPNLPSERHPRCHAEPVPADASTPAAADAPIEMKGIRLAGAPLYLDMQVHRSRAARHVEVSSVYLGHGFIAGAPCIAFIPSNSGKHHAAERRSDVPRCYVCCHTVARLCLAMLGLQATHLQIAQATTPLDPRVLDAMLPFMTDQYGNPHSRTHFFGWETEDAVEVARKEVRSYASQSAVRTLPQPAYCCCAAFGMHAALPRSASRRRRLAARKAPCLVLCGSPLSGSPPSPSPIARPVSCCAGCRVNPVSEVLAYQLHTAGICNYTPLGSATLTAS